jgi:hypothetical protein
VIRLVFGFVAAVVWIGVMLRHNINYLFFLHTTTPSSLRPTSILSSVVRVTVWLVGVLLVVIATVKLPFHSVRGGAGRVRK